VERQPYLPKASTWPADPHVRLPQEYTYLVCITLAATVLTHQVLGRTHRDPRVTACLAAAAAAGCKKFYHARVRACCFFSQHAVQLSLF